MDLLKKHEKEYIQESVPRKKILTDVGAHSLIGIFGDPPYDHANYFNFVDPNVRCANMWMENLDHLCQTGVLDGMVEVEMWQYQDRSWAVVDDDRVPDEYLNGEPCWTGYGAPPEPIREVMKQRYGWPDEE